MVVENNVSISSKQFVAGKSATNNNAVKTPPMPQDSVEISSKKEENKKTDWKKVAKAGLAFLGIIASGALIGAAIQRKCLLPKPEKMKKEYEEIIKRPLTEAEKTRIDDKCRKAKSHDTFVMDIIDALIFWV